MRREISHEHRKIAPLRGGPFTFRTFHGSDGRYTDPYGDRVQNTLDRLCTITLPVLAFGAEMASRVVEVTRVIVL